jgi:hypothetical protein
MLVFQLRQAVVHVQTIENPDSHSSPGKALVKLLSRVGTNPPIASSHGPSLLLRIINLGLQLRRVHVNLLELREMRIKNSHNTRQLKPVSCCASRGVSSTYRIIGAIGVAEE